jgi:hypothetical protein
MAALTPESYDAIARLFVNIAADVKDTGGVYRNDNFTRAEKQAIIRACDALTKKYQDAADRMRAKTWEEKE